MEQIAKTDTLTNAGNRLALQQDSANKLHSCATSHLLHFDLDWFKAVNDQYGHSAGDEVLKAIVQNVRDTLPDSEIYRVGGEEFCVIFCARDFSTAFDKAEMIRCSIEQLQITIDDNKIAVTISGGLLELPEKCMTNELDRALQRTDIALYKAKESGRNQIIKA